MDRLGTFESDRLHFASFVGQAFARRCHQIYFDRPFQMRHALPNHSLVTTDAKLCSQGTMLVGVNVHLEVPSVFPIQFASSPCVLLKPIDSSGFPGRSYASYSCINGWAQHM